MRFVCPIWQCAGFMKLIYEKENYLSPKLQCVKCGAIYNYFPKSSRKLIKSERLLPITAEESSILISTLNATLGRMRQGHVVGMIKRYEKLRNKIYDNARN